MAYSRKYNEEKYVEIKRFIDQLETLEEGTTLSIPTKSNEHADHLRWLFCDYFNLMGQNRVFKTSLFNNLILIGKNKPSLSTLTSNEKAGGVSKKLDALIQELLALPLPRVRIAELLLDESLTYTALGIVLAELGRVLGE